MLVLTNVLLGGSIPGSPVTLYDRVHVDALAVDTCAPPRTSACQHTGDRLARFARTFRPIRAGVVRHCGVPIRVGPTARLASHPGSHRPWRVRSAGRRSRRLISALRPGAPACRHDPGVARVRCRAAHDAPAMCWRLGIDLLREGIGLAHAPGLPHHVAVIIWLNGPFGIGKSTTAQALLRRLPQALLFDPEPFGAALRYTVANVETATDFQDLRAWPAVVIETARILRQMYAETLIVPLTVLKSASAETLAAS